MTGKRSMLSSVLVLAFGVAVVVPAVAQPYPTRPIKLIVPFSPGGPVDVTARIVGQHLPRILGQTVIIENRAGAAGALGAKAVASADPDGYTLLCGNISTLTVLPAVTDNRDYDPSKAFAPVAKVSQNHEVLVVHPAFSAKSVAELIALAKANPGKLNFGSAGHGNATHLAAELFKLRTGTDIVHVPYKGAAEAVTGVLGGQVQMFFGDIGGVLPLLREGTLRALAVSSATRNAARPGAADHDRERRARLRGARPMSAWWLRPALRRAIVDRLNAAINESLTSPDVAAAFAKMGAEVRPGPPQDFAAFLAAETEKWVAVVKAANIKVD